MRMQTTHFLRAILVFCLSAVLGLSVVDPAHAQVLQVSRLSNSPTGFVAERVVLEAARRARLPIQFRANEVPMLRAMTMLDSGELDAVMIRSKSIDGKFPNVIRLNVPSVTLDFGLYGRSPGIRAMSREELSRMTFGVPKGMTSAQTLVEGLKSSEGQSLVALLEMLTASRFDFAVLPFIEAEIEIRQRWPSVHVWPQYWGSEPLYFVLNRKHEALVAPLERALTQMVSEGIPRKYYDEVLREKGIQPLRN